MSDIKWLINGDHNVLRRDDVGWLRDLAARHIAPQQEGESEISYELRIFAIVYDIMDVLRLKALEKDLIPRAASRLFHRREETA